MDRGRVRDSRRWGQATPYAGPAVIAGALTPEQLDAYVLNYTIMELTDRLNRNDVMPSSFERSPSPTPQYDSFGKRTNTREARHREKVELKRSELVRQALRLIPNYTPPHGFKWHQKTQEKVFVPVREYPHINFVGQLLGPRGNTLRRMEHESGARLAIRGRGSVKEGRSGVSGQRDTLNEDLHVLVNGENEDSINAAVAAVRQVISTAISMPEFENSHKRDQLRELAALNGTLRDDESVFSGGPHKPTPPPDHSERPRSHADVEQNFEALRAEVKGEISREGTPDLACFSEAQMSTSVPRSESGALASLPSSVLSGLVHENGTPGPTAATTPPPPPGLSFATPATHGLLGPHAHSSLDVHVSFKAGPRLLSQPPPPPGLPAGSLSVSSAGSAPSRVPPPLANTSSGSLPIGPPPAGPPPTGPPPSGPVPDSLSTSGSLKPLEKVSTWSDTVSDD